MVILDTVVRGWAHLTASSIEELHEFAKKIGLKREWFQGEGRNKFRPHYDVKRGMVSKAVSAGAIKVTRRELSKFLKLTYPERVEMTYITDEQLEQDLLKHKFPRGCRGILPIWLKEDAPLLAVKSKQECMPEVNTFFTRDGSGRYINVI